MIVEKRFGLSDGSTATLQEIGQQLNITRERVRQLEARALKKLRMAVTRNWLETYFETLTHIWRGAWEVWTVSSGHS